MSLAKLAIAVLFLLLISTAISHQHKLLIKKDKITPIFTQTELKKIAELVTVRIFAQQQDYSRGGSGVLIGEDHGLYLVVTNNHVVSDEEINYQIQTHTGKVYPAQVVWQNKQNLIEDDLALLTFTSKEKYQKVTIKNSSLLSENQIVFASGFPFEENLKQSRKINFTMGSIMIILSEPLIGGYQLGYTNLLYNGMSGGSIVNQQGELIGINGLGKYPVLGNPYVYQNGTNISEQQIEIMSQLSWGIPSQYITNLINRLQQNQVIDTQISEVN